MDEVKRRSIPSLMRTKSFIRWSVWCQGKLLISCSSPLRRLHSYKLMIYSQDRTTLHFAGILTFSCMSNDKSYPSHVKEEKVWPRLTVRIYLVISIRLRFSHHEDCSWVLNFSRTTESFACQGDYLSRSEIPNWRQNDIVLYQGYELSTHHSCIAWPREDVGHLGHAVRKLRLRRSRRVWISRSFEDEDEDKKKNNDN